MNEQVMELITEAMKVVRYLETKNLRREALAVWLVIRLLQVELARKEHNSYAMSLN